MVSVISNALGLPMGYRLAADALVALHLGFVIFVIAGGLPVLRWPRLAVRSAWSRSDQPSSVFAHKLDAGEFAQEDFAIARLNAPAPVSHLATTLALEAPIDLFGKVGDQAEARTERTQVIREREGRDGHEQCADAYLAQGRLHRREDAEPREDPESPAPRRRDAV